MDLRLQQQKSYPRAMQSYTLMLYEFVRELKPKKMLEIGVCTGQSTKTILMALGANKSGQLVSIDRKNRQDILEADYPDLKQYWHLVVGSSHDSQTLQAVKNMLEDNELYDMAFIDGDHSYEGVKQDWNDYSPLVKPGGLIMLHDTINQNEGVNQLWNEITWEKFNLDWGRARNHVVPGFGIVRKPLE
jgi:predicted O-methyltransferase YrrM